MEDLYSIFFGILNIIFKIREYDIIFFLKFFFIRKCININLKFLVFGFRVLLNDYRFDVFVIRICKYIIYSIRFVYFNKFIGFNLNILWKI